VEYLIWGTGRCTKELLNDYAVGYFREHSILAFVDNDKKQWGKVFFSREIISPEAVENLSFDKILICSRINEKAILRQVIGKLKIDRKLVMTLREFEESFYNNLIENKSILNSRILMVGDKKICQMWKAYLNLLDLHVCGIVDIQSLEDIKEYQYDYVLLMRLINIPYLDRTVGKIELERQYVHGISQKCKMSEALILTDIVVDVLMKRDKYVSFGEENKNKTFLIIRLSSPTIGLGAFVIKVATNVEYAKNMGYIPVVDMMSQNQYLEDGELGKVNAWEKFFEQPAGYSLYDIRKSKNIIITSETKSFSKDIKLDFLRTKPELQKTMREYKATLRKNGKILGVLFRGSDYANLRPYKHNIQPDLKTMILKVKEKIDEWGGFDHIYLCTEVQEAVICFQEEFQDQLFFYPQERVSQDYCGYLAEHKFKKENGSYFRGADYWTVLNALSECDSLIACPCSGASITLMLNKNSYRHTYVFELGQYGLDNS